MKLLNNYKYSLGDQFWAPADISAVKSPKLLLYNEELDKELGLKLNRKQAIALLSGKKLDEAAIAMVYAGHQFGHFNPQLGDGRAALLGEVQAQDKLYDIHLKGSGPTLYSRGGDGLCPLGPALKEYIISEAMHALGVPSTRALGVIATGNQVYREEIHPGAIFARVALNHIRIGHFEYFAAKGDRESLLKLTEYARIRMYADAKDYEEFFDHVCQAQIKLVAQWMALGFIHGVMNTDNCTIGGFTIDYGPCAFMNNYQHNKVYSYIDRHGRYAYSNQAKIVIWNLTRLAECLSLIIEGDQQQVVSRLQAKIEDLQEEFSQEYQKQMNRKFGLENVKESDKDMLNSFLNFLEEEKMDFTHSFKNFISLESSNKNYLAFKELWNERQSDFSQKTFDAHNPYFIPRNHIVERVISKAYKGDWDEIYQLIKVLKHPYKKPLNSLAQQLSETSSDDVQNTFCGT